ncbi:hypothetical protein BX600DRAFT_438446 [Xylariales sp. PMI_506]|nr:hypothetical protein BX600DRAFT_438446 [Xylariales sp. PMI_506]
MKCVRLQLPKILFEIELLKYNCHQGEQLPRGRNLFYPSLTAFKKPTWLDVNFGIQDWSAPALCQFWPQYDLAIISCTGKHIFFTTRQLMQLLVLYLLCIERGHLAAHVDQRKSNAVVKEAILFSSRPVARMLQVGYRRATMAVVRLESSITKPYILIVVVVGVESPLVVIDVVRPESSIIKPDELVVIKLLLESAVVVGIVVEDVVRPESSIIRPDVLAVVVEVLLESVLDFGIVVTDVVRLESSIMDLDEMVVVKVLLDEMTDVEEVVDTNVSVVVIESSVHCKVASQLGNKKGLLL